MKTKDVTTVVTTTIRFTCDFDTLGGWDCDGPGWIQYEGTDQQDYDNSIPDGWREYVQTDGEDLHACPYCAGIVDSVFGTLGLPAPEKE